MKIAVIIAVALALGACATTVSRNEVATARFEPLPSDYQDKVRSFMLTYLKDPYTAHYVFQQPRRGYWQDGWAYGGRKHFGYIIPVSVNARNSFGGYVGFRQYYFGYENGQVYGITNLFVLPPKMAGFLE